MFVVAAFDSKNTPGAFTPSMNGAIVPRHLSYNEDKIYPEATSRFHQITLPTVYGY